LEVMQMDVQERGLRRRHAPPQGCLDVIDVVEALRAVQIDDQVRARALHSVPHREMIFAILHRLARDERG
jgi:hypothetical protein